MDLPQLCTQLWTSSVPWRICTGPCPSCQPGQVLWHPSASGSASVGWLCSTTSHSAWCPRVLGCVAQLSFNPVPCLQTLPIIVFLSCVMSILYYLGVMQWVILKVGSHSLIWDGSGKKNLLGSLSTAVS